MKIKIFRTIILVITALMTSLYSRAYDFESNGIYYNILSEAGKTVSVTYGSYASYEGNISIPERVVHDTDTYSVTGIGDEAFYYCEGMTSVTIPNTVTFIGDYTFYGCTGLTKVIIPNTVTSIGAHAFSFCTSLTEINIPNSISTIEGGTFEACSNLLQIILPNSVSSIKYSAFEGCTGITNIEIPASVSSIDNNVFRKCSNLTEINVHKNNQVYSSIDGALLNKDSTELICCPAGKTNFTIPASVLTINSNSFAYCEKLYEVQIPNSVTSIGSTAFFGCLNLTQLTIPSSVSSIGAGIIAACTNMTDISVNEANPHYRSIDGLLYDKDATKLKGCPGAKNNVNIPNTVTSIENRAFYSCNNLNSISIPNSVTYIGEAAFYGCNGFEKIEIPENITAIDHFAFGYCSNLIRVHISESVTDLGEYAFGYCNKLVDVNIPKSLTIIPNGLFAGCYNLTEIIIPESATMIGHWCFSECQLKEITIPKSVTSIGNGAFWCETLTKVYCKSSTPPEIFDSTFSDNTYENAQLYVPRGCKEKYEVAELWYNFSHINDYDFSGINEVIDDTEIKVVIENGRLIVKGLSDNDTVCIYKMDGELIYCGTQNVIPDLIRGTYIVKIGNAITKVAI